MRALRWAALLLLLLPSELGEAWRGRGFCEEAEARGNVRGIELCHVMWKLARHEMQRAP